MRPIATDGVAWSVQYTEAVLFNGPDNPKISLSALESAPHLIHGSFNWVHPFTHPNGISIGSAVFAGQKLLTKFPGLATSGLKSQDLEILWAIFAFFWKTTPYGKIFKTLFRKFTWRDQSTLLCSNVIKFVRREIVEIVRYLPDQKIWAASQTVASARIATKICQSQPPTMYSQCSRFHQNRFTFGGVIAERVKTVFCPEEYFQYRLFEPSLFEPIISRTLTKPLSAVQQP